MLKKSYHRLFLEGKGRGCERSADRYLGQSKDYLCTDGRHTDETIPELCTLEVSLLA